MRLTYDPKHSIGHNGLREKTEAVDPVRVSDEINIDLAADGTVYGVELLDTRNQHKAADGSHLVLVDSTGTERTVPRPVEVPGARRYRPLQLTAFRSLRKMAGRDGSPAAKWDVALVVARVAGRKVNK